MDSKTMKAATAAAAAALAIPMALSAQQERPPMEGQHNGTVRVEMRALSDEAVMGEVHLRTGSDAAAGDRMGMAHPVELEFDVRGLEPNQEVALLVHRGACSAGTTTIAELGRFTADGTGQLMQTETVRNEELSTLMTDEAREMDHDRM
ncbi:MAG: hypothetical protein KC645_10310, partial [Gemmatimonadetes bacterium]|nr:hypothetical protein [Gemmatimonadota bacterium]